MSRPPPPAAFVSGASRLRAVTLACVLGLAAPGLALAQEDVPPADSVAADTLPAAEPLPDTLRAPPPEPPDSAVVQLDPLRAEASPDTIRGLRLGIGRIPLLRPIDLEPSIAAARLRDRRPAQPATDWLDERLAEETVRRAARRDTLWAILQPMDKLGPGFDIRRFLVADTTRAALEPPAGAPRQGEIDIIPDALAGVADLEIDVDGTGQIGAQWQRFDPCTLNTGQRCNSTAIPTIQPDFQLRAVVRGTISERVFVDVDFDQTREFDATNNLNVYYRGKPGEILEFAEVGEVSLPLPRSQYISRAIPAGNFGVRAEGRLGPLTVRGVLAEQDGNVETRELTLDVGGGEQNVLQDFETVIDDAGFASGQFFFVVDPRELPGYPDIDVTGLQGTDAPVALRPVSGLKLYRHEIGSGQQNVEEGVIQARAVVERPPSADPTLPDSAEFQGFFRPLVEGEDYIAHSSGLWVVLRSRVLDGEALAISYITAAGDTVGDYNAEEIFREIANTGSGELPLLELMRDPATHRPGGITWEREMHQVYRISSAEDVELGSIELTISQGPIESGPIIRELGGEDFTFLQIFGLDENPTDDRLDLGRIWRPISSGGTEGGVTGTYVIFPTLEPFKNPPPIGQLDGPFPLADGDRNPDMYDEPVDQLRRSSFRYRLNFAYRARSSGRASSFSLGAIGIREGSDRVLLNGQELTRGVDYQIDYEIGQLEILRPNELFGATGTPQLEVRFEQKPVFQIQPTSIVGMTGTYELGDIGQVDFIGLLQREGSVLNRPELGLEPGAVSLGGLLADISVPAPALDRFVNSLPGISTDVESRIGVSAEAAGSLPTTNRRGLTYVDDFEGSSRLRIGLSTRSWRRASVVSRPDADGDDYLPDSPDLTNQLDAVWQSQFIGIDGQVQGSLLTFQIDPAINTGGQPTTEPVLWVRVGDAPPGENGWFSLTQVLSETGIDLTATEFLEFYALSLNSVSPRVAMIIDIGTVSEDALVADSLGFPAGVGLLDQEADPLVGVWGNADDTGLWDQACVAEPSVTAYPPGDPLANCTNNNGLEDTEDLNRDNFLNTDERYFRYIVPLNVDSRYKDRETGAEFPFTKYRVPLQVPDLMENAGVAFRQNVRHIRITFVSDRDETILVSRMEFSGSPWLKRGGGGSVDGTTGEQPGTAGAVAVGPISTTDAGYVSPPGISDEQAETTDEISLGAQPINEQSLRLQFEDVPAGERIEVYRRFTERPRDFLLYRQMRGWAIPVAGDFGSEGPLRFFLRVGFDTQNFYLYRTPLPDETGEMPTRDQWRPELLVDFDRWIQLRAEAERRLIDAGTLPPDSTLIVWDVDVFADGDSTHAIAISDRSRAPNLAAIREIALGVENVAELPAGPGEIWVDDLRLGEAADQSGGAVRAAVQMNLGDIARFETGFSRVDPFYRQLGAGPSYQAENDFRTRAHLEFGRFLPAGLGLAVPIDFQHVRDSSNPFFAQSSDLLAEEIDGLRTPSANATSWSIGLAKTRPSGSPILRSTIDGLRLGYSRQVSDQTATQSETNATSWNATASWARSVADASFPVLPGFLRDALDALPGFLSNSTIIENLKDLRFRYTPRDLSLGANLNRSTIERFRFTSPVAGAEAAVDPTIDRQFTLTPRAGFLLQPFPSLVAGLSISGARDLVDPSFRLTSPDGIEVLEDEQREFLGLPVGWEMNRTIGTNVAYQPVLASWFDPRLTINTSYGSNRNPSYVTAVSESGDTTFVRDIRMARDVGLDVDVRPGALLDVFGMPQARDATGFVRSLRVFWDRFRPIRFAWTRAVSASYDRRPINPSFGRQLVYLPFDDMRFLTATDTAAAAAERDRFQVRAGVQLPFTLDAEVDFSTTENIAYTQRSSRTTDETEWPSLRLTWRSVPVPGFLTSRVRSITLTGEYRDRERVTRTTTGQDQGNDIFERSVALTFVFQNGFNLSYSLLNSVNERTDGSGFSRSDRNSHTIRGTGSVPPPDFLSFVRNQLRLSAELTLNANADCRELGGGGFTGGGDPSALVGQACVDYVDQTTNNFTLTADTDYTGYSVGVQFQWVQRSSGVGTRQSSSQYNFNVFGRFYLRSRTSDLPSR